MTVETRKSLAVGKRFMVHGVYGRLFIVLLQVHVIRFCEKRSSITHMRLMKYMDTGFQVSYQLFIALRM